MLNLLIGLVAVSAVVYLLYGAVVIASIVDYLYYYGFKNLWGDMSKPKLFGVAIPTFLFICYFIGTYITR